MVTDGDGAANRPQHRNRPLEGRYGVLLTSAVLALVPFIITSTAWELFSEGVGKAIGGRQELDLVSGLGAAGYAFGALMAGDVINRFPQDVLFLILEAAFLAGALITASAHNVFQRAAGTMLQGFTTGLLLVVALPPVIRRFSAGKMPITSAAINMGFFGAIT